MASRTFGWVQDSHTIEKLQTTVEIFDHQSPVHRTLIDKQIPTLVREQDRRDRFLAELSRTPLKLKYKDLVGTARKDMCTGILQASLKGQKREFMRNWPAENYLRWAHALGFIKHDRGTDSFSITEFGLKYTRSHPKKVDSSQQLLLSFDQQKTEIDEEDILTQAFLSNPPVMRVLDLLADGSHLTKFEIGSQLGFVGEDGFTCLPQNILVRTVAQEENSKNRNRMFTDWEGTADKYARTIASWLISMRWVEQVKKPVVATFGDEKYESDISQAYVITPAGRRARNQGRGTNIRSRISKNVFWEMLATKGKDRAYIRTRRALILQEIAKKSQSVQALQQFLVEKGFNESEQTIANDLKGLKQIGLNIQQEQKGYFLQDTIQNLVVPSFATTETVKSDIQESIDRCRELLECVPHDYLVLIPLSFSGRPGSRLFEMKTVELLVDQCGFDGLRLGETDRPDGLIFTRELTENYGVIIDTKAYSKSFNIPRQEADKMTRYVNENIRRDSRHSPKWWERFPPDIDLFKFLFVSGKFGGEFEKQLSRISISTQDTPGAAITSYNLLLLAEEIAKQNVNLQDVAEKLSCLSEVEIGENDV